MFYRSAAVVALLPLVLAACDDDPAEPLSPLEIEISVTTVGPDPDPDGYIASIASQGEVQTALVPTNGTILVRDLPRRTYSISLQGATLNCNVTSSTFARVQGTWGGRQAVSFDVVCAASKSFAFVRWLDGNAEIYSARDDGTGLTRLTDHAAADLDPAWAPDGSRLAFASERDGNFEIYVMDRDGGALVRVTDNAGMDRYPAWSPDGSRILFSSERDGTIDLYAAAPDGSAVTRLTTAPGPDLDPTWSPDGARIAFVRDDALYTMNADGTDVQHVPLFDYDSYYDYYVSEFRVRAPEWSPDGSRLAFSLAWCEEGAEPMCHSSTIHTINPDGGEMIWLSTGTNTTLHPAWYPDGRKLTFAAAACISDVPDQCASVIRIARTGAEVRRDWYMTLELTEMADLVADDGRAPVWAP